MTTGNREDYLISILRLTEGEGITKTTELASFMNVSPASVTEMVKVLSNDGLVDYEKYRGIKLTEKGLYSARIIRKKHHVLENFLINVLNIDVATAHEEAHLLEHALSEESAIKICQMMGTPVDNDCQSCSAPCKAVLSDGVNITVPLSELNPGERGIIAHLKNDNPDIVKKLIMMGLIPGREILLGDSPEKNTTIITTDSNVVALDSNLTSSVFIDTNI